MSVRKMSLLGITCLILLFSCNKTEKILADVRIQIESPQQNAEVGLTEIVNGKVSNPKAQVYVLVHPLLTNLWWVQRIPSPPNQDGTWQTLCYFGTETKGIGESFEIAAIVTKDKLEEGQMLPELPKDVVRSDIVTVRRAR